MKSTVTNKAGLVWIVSLLVMTMALFTNVDSALAGGNKGPIQQSAEKGAEAATKFDSAKWLELYKKNGWDKSKFVRLSQERSSSTISEMSPDLKALHQKLEGESKMAELRNRKVKTIKPFKNAQKVSALKLSGKLRSRSINFAAGTTTILLNGSNPDTISVGDSLEVTINLSGDTAWVDLYWDANDNQMVDTSDFLLFDDDDDNFIVDNGFEDEDTTTGIIQITLYPYGFDEDDWLLLGDNGFLLVAYDGPTAADADTAALWIESVPTGFSVSGSVDGHENILIWAESCMDESCFDFGPDGAALTTSDASGNYTINLPASGTGYWMIGAVDVFEVTGGLLPSPPAQVVFVIGAEIGVDFLFVTGDATIVVTLSDENGIAIEGVLISAESFGFGGGAEDTTNAAGAVSFEVVEGEWYIYVEPSNLLPDYLVPFSEVVFVASGATEVVNLVAFTNDDSITGTTYLNNVATGEFTVAGYSELGYTETVSQDSSSAFWNGYYSLPVSSLADTVMYNSGYCVSVCHLSSNQYVVQDHYNVPSGSDSIDIYILEAEGYIEGTVYDADTFEPIPWAGVCAGDESDTTGVSFNCRGTDEFGYYEIPVQNGTYVVAAFAEGYQVEWVDSVLVNFDTVWVDFHLERFDAGEPGTIYGTVYNANIDDPVPVPDANVEVFNDFFSASVRTDSLGDYWIDVPGGLYQMVASAIGFFPDWVDSVVVDSNIVNVDFYLEESDGVCYPDVRQVTDVPNDQGREVLVTWPRACLDFADIEFYSLWRLPDERGMGGAPTHMSTIPEAGWGVYSKPAATLGDSIAQDDIWWSTYIVIAHTEFDDVFLQGWPNRGYSVDNLIPSAPTLSGSEDNGGVSLTWTEIPEEEAKYYTVYKRDVTAGGSFEALVNVIEIAFVDLNVLIDNSYAYYVTATDFANNEGNTSNEYTLMVTSVDNLKNAIPDEFALGQNYPNPFNPTTSISYQLPVSGNVRLHVYNLNGELVNTLVNGEMAAGYHTVKWNGLTSTGKVIASGVYLYRIQAGDFVQVRKMIMMK